MPLAARMALVAAIAALAVVVATTVSGALPRVVGSFGSALGGITGAILKTPVPSPSLPAIPASPTLAAPQEPYTNQATATVAGSVPADVVGHSGFAVRIYIAVPGQPPVAVRDVPVGETTQFAAEDVPLEPGRNDISATTVAPGGESEMSPVVTYVLDQAKPTIAVTSPANKSIVAGPVATITGTTKGQSTIVARNEANGTAASSTAAASGAFSLKVPLSAGTNGINLTATDQAGNVGTTILTLRRGSSNLAVVMAASAYQISAARLPSTIELRAVVTAPGGQRLVGQSVTFTLSIPGVPAITGEDVTDGSGLATFRTTVPAGATLGSGLATAFVTTADYGDASGRTAITIVP